jgi:cytochrome c oxidase subunit II
MGMAVALVVIVAAVLLFHLLSPWWLTPLASQWREMDATLGITFVITGIFFVGINLFVALAVWRFRHREGRRAAYEPDNKRLERWLTIGTSIAIIGLLAPGLFVYADYVKAPDDAIEVEALAQQWQWRFRFPGEDARMGATEVRFSNGQNPFGIDPDDPVGHSDVLVHGGELHLPLGRPVKMLLRSQDVLHDFYVPQFRARMNIVPGMVSSFWFTPTVAGRYEILCAQLCGVGHYNMRGYVVVEPEAAFQAWLREQPTFARSMEEQKRPPPSAGAGATKAEQGRALAQSKGCTACHSIDGKAGVGPTWKGLFGKTVTLADGSSVLADESYLLRAIREPMAQVVKDYPPIMPKLDLSADEAAALAAYIESQGRAGQQPPVEGAKK